MILQCTSYMLNSIEDNGCSREVGLYFRGVVNSGYTANITINLSSICILYLLRNNKFYINSEI